MISILEASLSDIPGGLVVRIRRSHRRGRGSIPRLGRTFLNIYSFEYHIEFGAISTFFLKHYKLVFANINRFVLNCEYSIRQKGTELEYISMLGQSYNRLPP